MRVQTENPYRDIWTAIDADNYEPGAPMGQANTEQAAINALVEKLIEAAETHAYAEGRRDEAADQRLRSQT